MEKKREKRHIRPDPLPHKPSIVDPIVAADSLFCPGQNGILSDTDGSYTGRPVDGGQPVQDADDL